MLSAPSASQKVSFHILLRFPFCLRHNEYDKDGSEEADASKEEVCVVDVERLCEIFISSSISNIYHSVGDDLSSAWIEANHQESTEPVEGGAQRGTEVLMKKMVKILIS